MSFTADVVGTLPGPGWLQARRRDAFERFLATSRPTLDQEVWRYSRIEELDLDRYAPVAAPQDRPSGVPDELADLLTAIGPAAAVVVVRNGHVVHLDLEEPLSAKGLVVARLADTDGDGTSLGAVTGPARDAFGELQSAFVAEPVLVRVPAGMVVERPVVLLNWTDAPGGAVFTHLVVEAGEDSELTVYDHQGSAEVDAVVLPVVELDVGAAARLRYLNAQVLGHDVWQLGRQASRVGRDATLATTMVALGGDYARLAIESTMEGRGGSGEMLAVYFGEGDQMQDFRTLQDHVAPATTSNLLFKGAVEDRSRSVYTGLIHIGKQAAGVNAFQTNRNVKLSADAWAESVPNLEIENNDVHCSHASAVGPVDEDQLFYLESRGVPPEVAERLIVLGFFEEVLDRLPVQGAVDLLRTEIADKLERRDG